MLLLALDPSSTCVGYALLRGLDPEDLVEAGRLTPSLAKSVHVGEPAWLQAHLRQRELQAMRRIDSLIQEVELLISEHVPDLIVVETPSGLFGTGARRGARGSLTTYGLAAGRVFEACRRLRPGCVAPVTERMWARGGGKEMRMCAVEQLYPGRYDHEQDSDAGDAADAILLGRWWLDRSRQATAAEFVGPPRGG